MTQTEYPNCLPRGRPWARAALLAIAAAAICNALPARATLGEDLRSVEGDRLVMQAASDHVPRIAYSVHTLTAQGGMVVREYVSNSGAVFGVAWSGPSMPNLKQLLGATHFDTYVNSPRRQHGGRGHLLVNDGNLVVESNGHMRAFFGRAYLLNAVPAGVRIDEIQ
jgi:hypothetical protein